MVGHEDDRVVVPAPPGPQGHEVGSTETDEPFRSPFSRKKALGLKETAVVASAATKMKQRASKTRQIATLKSKSKEGIGKQESVRAEDIRFAPTYGSLESIQVMQARVRVRADRARRRRAGASNKKADKKKLDLTLRMMLGVRVAVGRQRAEPALQKLEDDDFTQVDHYVFPPAGSEGRLSTPSHQLNKTFKFKDYAPKAFKNLRRMFAIDELSYIMSVAGIYDYLELITNSKSGSFFFFSHDQKYIIKSMKRSEAKFFQRILPKYYEHHQLHPDSLLVRFCGMYMVKSDGKKIPFLVMTCIDGQALKRIHTKYDLKGSSWHRKAKDGDKVLKDNDLREADGKFRFGFQREAILKALQADAEFLRDVNVMDYSVFMSVHDSSRPTAPIDRRELLRRENSAFFVFADNEPDFTRVTSLEAIKEEGGDEKSEEENTGGKAYSPVSARHRQIRFRPDGGIESEGDGPREVYWVGIIDVLTEFTVKRQLEAWYKSIGRDGSTVSCVEPVLYCERFVNFMTERTV